jgi:outer membrane protein TolC
LRARDLKEQVELEVQALLKLSVARQQVWVAGQTVALAREEIAQNCRRYDAGLGGGMSMLEAQTGLARAMDEEIAAVHAWNQARIDLMQATGTIRSLAQ